MNERTEGRTVGWMDGEQLNILVQCIIQYTFNICGKIIIILYYKTWRWLTRKLVNYHWNHAADTNPGELSYAEIIPHSHHCRVLDAIYAN